MRKIILILSLFFVLLSQSVNAQENEINKNVENIENTLRKYQLENSYIDYDYPELHFSGRLTTDSLDITFYVKDSSGNTIPYNGIIDIEPLVFGDSFSFGEIPKNTVIVNGKGNLRFPVTVLKDLVDEKSGIGLIITTQNKDIVGNIVIFAYAENLINVNTYLSRLVGSLKVNPPKDMDIHKKYLLNSHNLIFNPNFTKEINIFPIAGKIKSPKDISKNPFLVGLNILLALLYLFTFYFTAQLFNSYFEGLLEKNDWNKKIGVFITYVAIFPISKFGEFLDFLYKKIGFRFGIVFNAKIGNFLVKYRHTFFIILCFIILGIIGQIVIDDFDLLSLQGWYIICIITFILGFITIFKDMLLYLLNKGAEKDNLKMEAIPTGYILAFIVAIFGRVIGMIPGVMFGTTIKISTKSDVTSKRLAEPSLLFRILIISFLFGLICWFLTLLFSSNTFIYKFLIVVYFGLINDTFFALLPFGMLWGVHILKDKKMKLRWFIFSFIVFLFFLHTIINPEGDLNKVMHFHGNLLILVLVLIFWILATIISYFYIKFKK